MRRRAFLTGAVASAGLAAWPRTASAAPWAGAPDGAGFALLPEGVRAEKMLEIFLYGGLSTFEGFYVVPDYGRPDDPDPALRGTQWHLFADDHARVFGGLCGQEEDSWLSPWTVDANGMMVHLGPLVAPLRNRPDILARMRVVVTRHDLEPHEAAIPLALSGHRLGSPRLAGMGTHVQRYFQERDTSGQVVPHAYVLEPQGSVSTDNLRVADAVGTHPGSARPLRVRVSTSNDLATTLERGAVGDARDAYDALTRFYTDRTRARYTHGGQPLRSRGLADHAFALDTLQSADALAAVIGGDLLAPFGGESCADRSRNDFTGMSLKAAAELLTHPTTPARYVNVIDGGLIMADGGGAFDTHFFHLKPQARNATHTFSQLADLIREPGDTDPRKIDLDETMILIGSEFGRTPFRQGRGRGTNHHPYGYVTVLIGGPVGPDQAGLVGTIGADGNAQDFVNPSEIRVAALAAMGMYPFTHDSFAVGDVRDVGSELEALMWASEHILGRRV